MNIPVLDQTLARVTPQRFGAVADGQHDDTAALLAAIKYASDYGMILELSKGEYRTDEVLVLRDITVLSQDARISYYGIHKNRPAIDMKDNVSIFGKLTVWARDNSKECPGNHGNRAAMAFGVYDNGEGAHHCFVEDLTILKGGMPNANGVIITGDSSDITLGRVTVPVGTDVYRGVLIHWGNAQDHYPKGNTWSVENGYGHVENWKPTTHPHDIHIGVVDCSGIEDAGINDSRAAFHIAAGYDIDVEEVIMNDGFHAVAITGADQGFEYAAPEIKALGGQRNIHIKKITGRRLRNVGLYVVSYVLMDSAISVNTELTVDEVDLEAVPTCQTVGMSFHSTKSVKIGKATVRGYSTHAAFHMDKDNQDVQVGELNVVNCSCPAVWLTNRKGNAPQSKKLQIDKLNVCNSGNGDTAAIIPERIDAMQVEAVCMEQSKYTAVVDPAHASETVQIGAVYTR